MRWGITRLLGSLEDLSLDCPASSKFAVEHLQEIVAANLVTYTFLKRCQLLRVGGAPGLTVLEAARAWTPTKDGLSPAAAAEALAEKELDAKNVLGTGAKKDDNSSPDVATCPGAFLCSTKRWILAVLYEAGMDRNLAKRVCTGTAEYLVDEGQ